MSRPASSAAVVWFISSIAAIPLAHADIYTWVDAAGMVNVSNLAPPTDARVTSVLRTDAAAAEAARDAARAAQLQALTDRVRQLEQEVERARSDPPPPTQHAHAAPAAVSYVAPVPQHVQYVAEPAVPVVRYGCDPSWAGCALSWGWPVFYPPVVLIGDSGRHRHHRQHGHGHGHGSRGAGHRFGAFAAMHAPGRGPMHAPGRGRGR